VAVIAPITLSLCASAKSVQEPTNEVGAGG